MQRDIGQRCHLYIPVLFCSAPGDCGAVFLSTNLKQNFSEQKGKVPDDTFEFNK